MKGFTTLPYSEYHSVLEAVLDQAATADYELTAFRFADDVAKRSVSPTMLQDAAFYDGKKTSFVRLCEHIEKDRAPGKVSLVLTDLVQSELVEDQRALARAFAGLARNGFKVTLLGFRSAFVGTYWVESHPAKGSRLALNLRGAPAEEARPFYLLMIAPTAQDLAEARRDLIADLKAANEYAASDLAIAVEKVELGMLPGIPVRLWSAYSEPIIEDAEEGGSRILYQVFDFGSASDRDEEIRLRFLVTEESEVPASRLRTGRGVTVEVEARSFAQGTWSTREVKRDSVEVQLPGGDRVMEVVVRAARPQPGSWDVYRIRLSPGSRNLYSPSWVADWNTNDDRTRAMAHRTLNLDLFVEALKTSITEKTPFIDLFLQVGRGDA